MFSRRIAQSLLHDKEYTKRVLPHLSSDYFKDRTDRAIYESVNWFIRRYNDFPTPEAILFDLGSKEPHTEVKLSEDEWADTKGVLINSTPDDVNLEWLVEETEKFCQDAAIENAVVEAIKIINDGREGVSKLAPRTAIPKMLSDALAVSFESKIGHDYFEDAQSQWDLYHYRPKKLPTGLGWLDKITRDGFNPKTLNVFIAPVHVGKTLMLCHLAGSMLTQGKKILYITLEMDEASIRTRIDANLLGCDVETLERLPNDLYLAKVARVREHTEGLLKIKEYPTSTAGAGHFRYLLSELKVKKSFVPDGIFIDYLNICCSTRVKQNGQHGMYEYVKWITEEIRGLAGEEGVPVITATQTTRGAFKSTDIDMDDTAESWGLPATADLMVALVRTDELDRLGQMLAIQLKNRYRNKMLDTRGLIGVDLNHFRLYDVEATAQSSVVPAIVLPTPGSIPLPAGKTSGFRGLI